MAREFSDPRAEALAGAARRVTSIRLFHPTDLDGIIRIEKSSFGIDAWPAALFRYYAGECPALFFVAVVDRRVAGYSIACVAGEAAEVVSIAVSALPRPANCQEAVGQDDGKGAASWCHIRLAHGAAREQGRHSVV